MPKVDAPNHPVGVSAQEYREAEVLLARSDLPYTVLRNAPYAELHVVERLLPAIQAGEVRINSGAGTAAFIARADIAEAAIAVLLQDGHAGKTYDLTGPELLTYGEVTRQLAEFIGKPILYVEQDDSTFEREARAAGLQASQAETLTRIGLDIREGYFAVRTDFFRQVTGTIRRTYVL